MPDFNRREITPTRLIALSFVVVILLGSLLLMLPISSKSGEVTSFADSLFTATSATCVTGLVVVDTYTHWSVVGQIIIMLLIQIGGLGFITILSMVSIIRGKKIGLFERTLLMESAGFLQLGGVIRMVLRMLKGTFLIEAVGALILSLRFYSEMGFFKAIFYGIFHSVSAFCNAGFDLMGKDSPFSSITAYSNDATIILTLSALIIMGGIGFLVWDDILIKKTNFKLYRLHTKIVLTSTVLLIVAGMFIFLILEFNNAFLGMSVKKTLLSSFFASVTPRTAGFNTVDLTKFSSASVLLTIILMAVGASPGSTGGGMKTTTVAVLMLSAVSSSRNNDSINVFKRRIAQSTLKKAASIMFLYVASAMAACVVILAVDSFSVKEVLFEVFSAIGTVGLTLGITTKLSIVSKAVIIFLMVGGRVGSLTVILALSKKRDVIPINRPEEKITVG